MCRLVVDVVADVFRDVLRIRNPEHQLQNFLQTYKPTLLPSSSRKLLNHSQELQLYPGGHPSGTITYTEMDVSLTYILLRNIANIMPPVLRWGGHHPTSDTSLAASVDRLREVRNSLYGHAQTASMSDPDFQRAWTDIENDIVNIENLILGGTTLYRDAMNSLLTECMDTEMQKDYVNKIRQMEQNEQNMQTRIDQIVTGVDDLGTRVDTVETSLTELGTRADTGLVDLGTRVDTVEARMEEMDNRARSAEETNIAEQGTPDERIQSK